MGRRSSCTRIALWLVLGAILVGPGCLTLNSAGEPAGRQKGLSVVKICPRCLEELGESHVCWGQPMRSGSPSGD